MKSHQADRPRQADRNGAVLLCVLACLGIATTIVMVSVRSTLRARRQMRQELQLEQTRWLLDAGISHAKSRLKNDPNYRGDTWNVAPELGGYAEASVDISAPSDDSPSDLRTLRITARLNTDEALSKPTVRSRELLIK